jgi:hypothetical protein
MNLVLKQGEGFRPDLVLVFSGICGLFVIRPTSFLTLYKAIIKLFSFYPKTAQLTLGSHSRELSPPVEANR